MAESSVDFNLNFAPELIRTDLFKDTASQDFFSRWCALNDSIEPAFVSRGVWRNLSPEDILKDKDNGKKELIIPSGLHLWEVFPLILAVDADTYAKKPELATRRVDKLYAFGNFLDKASVYLTEYTDKVYHSHRSEVPAALIQMNTVFRDYSVFLKNLTPDQKYHEDTITLEDKRAIDRWLLGDTAYEKRLQRHGGVSEEEEETLRVKSLAAYFKALGHTSYKSPVNPGPFAHIQEVTSQGVTQVILAPQKELISTIHARGGEKLLEEMPDVALRKFVEGIFGSSKLSLEYGTMYDALNIPKLKEELRLARAEMASSEISKKELEIVGVIQKAVCAVDYLSKATSPTKMVSEGVLNCVGAVTLAGSFLDELGIKNLVAKTVGHITTVVVTNDGKSYWRDFTPEAGFERNMQLTSDVLKDVDGRGERVAAFLHNPSETPTPFKVLIAGSSEDVIFQEKEHGILIDVLPESMVLLYNESIRGKEATLEVQELARAYRNLMEFYTRIYPDDFVGHRYLAQFYLKEHNYTKAAVELATAARLEKFTTFSQELITKYGLTEKVHHLNEVAHELELVQRELRFEPDNVGNLALAAELLTELGDTEGVINVQEHILLLTPGDTLSRLALAETYFVEGSFAKAREHASYLLTHVSPEEPGYADAADLFRQTVVKIMQGR